MVLADDHRCSNSTGSGAVRPTAGGGTNSATRSGKKQKHDKVPQRGLGVAELERILRDQQKSTTAATASQPTCNPASGLIIPPPPHLLRHRTLNAPGPALEPGSLFKPPAIPITPSPAPSSAIMLGPPRPDVGALMGGPQGAAAALWSHYQIAPSPEAGISGLPPPPVPHYSDGVADPVWSSHGYGQQQRRSPAQQHQQKHPPLAFPMVSTTISPSTSGANLQMEPPSNQINISSSTNCLLPPWPEQERIGGMRPPWSFPFETVPGNAYHPTNLPPFPRPEELPSIQGLDPLKLPLRGSNTSAALQHVLNASYHNRSSSNDNSTKENGSAKDEPFPGSPLPPPLPLHSASATNANPSNSSRATQLTPALPSNNLRELPEIGSLHYFYAHLDETLPPHFTSQLQTTPYYDFFPVKVDARETASTKQGGNPADHIDLDLKL